RKTSQPSGSTDSAMAATHETKTPVAGITVASTTSRASLAVENTVLPNGTHTALRNPVNTPSCRVSTDQATTAPTKASPGTTPLRKWYEGPHNPSVSRKTPV